MRTLVYTWQHQQLFCLYLLILSFTSISISARRPMHPSSATLNAVASLFFWLRLPHVGNIVLFSVPQCFDLKSFCNVINEPRVATKCRFQPMKSQRGVYRRGNDLPLSNHCGRARRHAPRLFTGTCTPACTLSLVEMEKCPEKAKRTVKRTQVDVRLRCMFFVDCGKLWRNTSAFIVWRCFWGKMVPIDYCLFSLFGCASLSWYANSSG